MATDLRTLGPAEEPVGILATTGERDQTRIVPTGEADRLQSRRNLLSIAIQFKERPVVGVDVLQRD